MEFVSKNLKRIAAIGAAVALVSNTYANVYANQFRYFYHPDQNKSAAVLQIKQDRYQSIEKYDPKPDIKILPIHYFDGFVGFFNPETKGIGVVSNERAPAENGVYSWEHIIGHEGLHWEADRLGLDHDEAWFNRLIANRLAYKSGTDKFPFASYLSYSIF